MNMDEEDDRPFADILRDFAHPTERGQPQHDPRLRRLSAVTAAIIELTGSHQGDCSASKVYANTVTALEGTLASDMDSNSLATQLALLQLLVTTMPHVKPPTILTATLPLSSRVIRAVISSIIPSRSSVEIEAKEELEMMNTILQWACRAATQVLTFIESSADGNVVKHLITGSYLLLLRDRHLKVQKASQQGILELVMREGRCHPAVLKTVSIYIHGELAIATKSQSSEALTHLLPVIPVIGRTILFLDYQKLSTEVMELLTALLQVQDLTATADYVTVTKVREMTPKIQSICAILLVVLGLLEDDNPQRRSHLDEFATRVCASLLQAKPNLVFRPGVAESATLHHGKIQFGQTLIASTRRLLTSNKELGCKLTPLSVQLVVLLSSPDEEHPDDATVGETLLLELTRLFRVELKTLIGHQPIDIKKCLLDTLRHMEAILQPLYSSTWPAALNCLVVLLHVVHQQDLSIQQSVENIVSLRQRMPSGSPRQFVVESAISTLVQLVGIEKCWDLIRIHPVDKETGAYAPVVLALGLQAKKIECTHRSLVSQDLDPERVWLLATLKSAAAIAQPSPPTLSFFQTKVLGLAHLCDAKVVQSSKDSQFYRMRVVELWSFLSFFCKAPSDLESMLPSLCKTLGGALRDNRYPELVRIVTNGLIVLCASQNEKIKSDGGLEVEKAAFATAAVSLLPIMFKLVSESGESSHAKSAESMELDIPADNVVNSSSEGQKIRSITDAIAAVAQFAPKPFLRNLFQKLMHRLLEVVQNPDNLDKVYSLLSLSESLVAAKALDSSSVSFLYRALKPLIRDDKLNSRIQKRAYRVLSEICQHYHSFVSSEGLLKELTELLSNTMMTSQVSSRYMRLKCLNFVIVGWREQNNNLMNEVKTILGEVLLCLKDPNSKSREMSYQVLLSMALRCGVSEVTKLVAAALGAATPHMRSAAVMALSRLTFVYGKNDTTFHAMLPSLLRTVLILIDEDSREVIKSVIGFIRITVSVLPQEQLKPLLPDLVASLLTFHKKKDRFRSKIKIIMKKLVRAFGYESVQPYVPSTEERLLTHMRKLDERLKRKKKLKLEQHQRPDTEEFEGMMESDEDDSDDGRTLTSGFTGFTQSTRGDRSKKSIAGKSLGRTSLSTKSRTFGKIAEPFRLPDETDGELVDMLGANIAKRVHFQDEEGSESDSSRSFEIGSDGRIIVRVDSHDLHQQEPNRIEDEASLRNRSKKRRFDKIQPSTSVDSHSRKKPSANRKQKSELGAAYKSKKAGGDVKKKGQKYEPFAFVPLDGRSYSRKNRRSAIEQMSTVVRGGAKRKRK